MWYVMRADPGARIAIGFRESISRERLRESAISGEIERLLNWFEVEAGDAFLLPAGTVHAIGGGLALCEVQQHSDITYRLYDYGRPRELHLDKAIQVASTEASTPKSVMLPIDCQYFHTELARTTSPLLYKPEPQRFHVVIFISGMGTIGGQQFREGEAWLVPPGGQPFHIEPAEPSEISAHLGAVSHADSQLIHALQRRATNPADDRGTIAAHQRIGYGCVTAWAIKFDFRAVDRSHFIGHY